MGSVEAVGPVGSGVSGDDLLTEASVDVQGASVGPEVVMEVASDRSNSGVVGATTASTAVVGSVEGPAVGSGTSNEPSGLMEEVVSDGSGLVEATAVAEAGPDAESEAETIPAVEVETTPAGTSNETSGSMEVVSDGSGLVEATAVAEAGPDVRFFLFFRCLLFGRLRFLWGLLRICCRDLIWGIRLPSCSKCPYTFPLSSLSKTKKELGF